MRSTKSGPGRCKRSLGILGELKPKSESAFSPNKDWISVVISSVILFLLSSTSCASDDLNSFQREKLIGIVSESVLIVMLRGFLACVANWRYTPYFRWIMGCARSREPDGDNDLTIRKFVRRPSGEAALENL